MYWPKLYMSPVTLLFVKDDPVFRFTEETAQYSSPILSSKEKNPSPHKHWREMSSIFWRNWLWNDNTKRLQPSCQAAALLILVCYGLNTMLSTVNQCVFHTLMVQYWTGRFYYIDVRRQKGQEILKFNVQPGLLITVSITHKIVGKQICSSVWTKTVN